jgi:hypothetical protein
MLLRALGIASSLAVVDVAALGADRVTRPGHVQLGDGTSLILQGNTSIAIDRDGIADRVAPKIISVRVLSGSKRFVRGANDKSCYPEKLHLEVYRPAIANRTHRSSIDVHDTKKRSDPARLVLRGGRWQTSAWHPASILANDPRQQSHQASRN